MKRLNLIFSITALAFFAGIFVAIQPGNREKTEIPSLSSTDKLTLFNFMGKDLAFTYISDDVARYDFGGGYSVIGDHIIYRPSAHFHKVGLGLYRRSDSWNY